MINKLRARMQDEKGFTLIELLVVILIIGILAAIALPAFLNQRAKAQDSTAKSDVRTAQTAMETYYTDNQTYTGAASTRPALNDVPAVHRAGPEERQHAGRHRRRRRHRLHHLGRVRSASDGTVYTHHQRRGTVTRTCDQTSKGGCPPPAPGSHYLAN